jgi:hypothetical protein
MTTPTTSGGDQSGSGLADIAGNLAVQALQQALPQEVQDILKPGKTPDRIQHAIAWAARRDPEVLAVHRKRGHKVNSFEDIQHLKLSQMDHVAKHFTRRFRRRAALTGAITGLPGGLWALVAAGADVQLTAVYAVRMAADVAQSYGYDTSLMDEQAHLAEVLALAAGIDSLRGVGNWLTREGLIRVLPDLLPRVAAKLSVQLTEEQAAKWAGRIVPGLGAAVGGAIDYTFLRVAGERAIAYYHNRYQIEHGMAPDNSRLSPPARVFEALASPAPSPQLAQPGQPANVVDSTLAAPGSAQPAAAVTSAQASLPASLAQPSRLPAPQYVPPHKVRKSAPERFGVYLAIFAVFALAITIAACAALGILISNGVHNLIH